MKRILSLLLLLAATMFTTALHAQGHFDWVKSYSGQEPTGKFWNYIVSSVTDSHGNLYVAGQFARGASVDGQDLLPFPPHGGEINNPNACIMKISPDGNVLWMKILHGNYGASSSIHSIQLVGDTSLYAYASVCIPMFDDEYLYYYDTLITRNNLQYLLTTDSMAADMTTSAIAVFDVDGHLRENTILCMAYKDSRGNIITLDKQTNNAFDSVYIAVQPFKAGAFCVDIHGNIFIGHRSTDAMWLFCDTCDNQSQYYDLSNGRISEVVIMVNGRQAFSDTPSSHPTTSNYRIMKFAPHFEGMSECRYVFSGETSAWEYAANWQLCSDSDNNIYLLCNASVRDNPSIVSLNGSNGMAARISHTEDGMVIKFDNNLTPIGITQLNMNDDNYSYPMSSSIFNHVLFDSDSNSMIIMGSIYRPEDEYALGTDINGAAVETGAANAYFIRVDRATNTPQSCGTAQSPYYTTLVTSKDNMNACAKNGRIITYVGFRGGIQAGDNTINIGSNKLGAGIYQWDYSGNCIGFIDLNYEADNLLMSSSLALIDSVLYISGGMTKPIQFSDTVIYPSGNSTAFIARYVDTSFMTPYGYVDTTGNGGGGSTGGDTNDVRIILPEEGTALVAYPNPFRQRVNVEYSGQQPITAAYLTDIMGRTEQVELSATAPGHYTLDLTARPQAAYLLTLVTQDGHRHTVRLLKQSEVFGQ